MLGQSIKHSGIYQDMILMPDQVVKEGEDVVLACKAGGHPGNLYINRTYGYY